MIQPIQQLLVGDNKLSVIIVPDNCKSHLVAHAVFTRYSLEQSLDSSDQSLESWLVPRVASWLLHDDEGSACKILTFPNENFLWSAG
jgi:hypothetical protein